MLPLFYVAPPLPVRSVWISTEQGWRPSVPSVGPESQAKWAVVAKVGVRLDFISPRVFPSVPRPGDSDPEACRLVGIRHGRVHWQR